MEIEAPSGHTPSITDSLSKANNTLNKITKGLHAKNSAETEAWSNVMALSSGLNNLALTMLLEHDVMDLGEMERSELDALTQRELSDLDIVMVQDQKRFTILYGEPLDILVAEFEGDNVRAGKFDRTELKSTSILGAMRAADASEVINYNQENDSTSVTGSSTALHQLGEAINETLKKGLMDTQFLLPRSRVRFFMGHT